MNANPLLSCDTILLKGWQCYMYIYIIAIIETLVNPCTTCVNFLRTSPLSQVVLLHKDRGQLRERSWNETGSKFHNYRTPVYNRDNARKVFNASS